MGKVCISVCDGRGGAGLYPKPRWDRANGAVAAFLAHKAAAESFWDASNSWMCFLDAPSRLLSQIASLCSPGRASQPQARPLLCPCPCRRCKWRRWMETREAEAGAASHGPYPSSVHLQWCFGCHSRSEQFLENRSTGLLRKACIPGDKTQWTRPMQSRRGKFDQGTSRRTGALLGTVLGASCAQSRALAASQKELAGSLWKRSRNWQERLKKYPHVAWTLRSLGPAAARGDVGQHWKDPARRLHGLPRESQT